METRAVAFMAALGLSWVLFTPLAVALALSLMHKEIRLVDLPAPPPQYIVVIRAERNGNVEACREPIPRLADGESDRHPSFAAVLEQPSRTMAHWPDDLVLILQASTESPWP